MHYFDEHIDVFLFRIGTIEKDLEIHFGRVEMIDQMRTFETDVPKDDFAYVYIIRFDCIVIMRKDGCDFLKKRRLRSESLSSTYWINGFFNVDPFVGAGFRRWWSLRFQGYGNFNWSWFLFCKERSNTTKMNCACRTSLSPDEMRLTLLSLLRSSFGTALLRSNAIR